MGSFSQFITQEIWWRKLSVSLHRLSDQDTKTQVKLDRRRNKNEINPLFRKTFSSQPRENRTPMLNPPMRPSPAHKYFLWNLRVEKILAILSTVVFGSLNHEVQGSTGLGPLASLQTTIRVDPELLRLEESIKAKPLVSHEP
jgi:hypothetical protein